ncbi:PSD1 and planctomycete cytochrome C domain-containing protein [Thalassoglobus sp.]|uniref:PSD1 and planctomycete cytochrome C domain-containing protein n=1 Tax=Thalassoglobus sp. TaxID=2795869 RepID=UPI003AA93187
MMRLFVSSAVVISITFAIVSSVTAEDLEFNRDIRPILSDKCFFCHGPDEEDRQADLRLDKSEAAHEYAIVPGKPEESELIARLLNPDPELRMPPADSEKHLSEEEIKLLTDWIKQGAKYEPFWAYVPPKPRESKTNEKASTPTLIDSFILEKLVAEGLQFSSPAEPVTLIRRLYFDLIGLPPSPEEVDAFVSDHSEKAYRDIIDKLLASDHFGERMAIYWLDLVRYADTVGYHGDQDHHISPYRDWVIEAFNDNMPFDQFTREQLAGDLLPDSTIDQKIATGYNRLLQTSHEGGVQPKEYLSIYAADRVRNLSSVWMGATVGCAQCHSHKYDPYTIQDFYSLAAFFADIDEDQHFYIGSNALPTRRPPELEVISQRGRERLVEIEHSLETIPMSQSKRRGVLEAEKKEIEESARLTMVTVAKEPREMRVLPRGNWLDDSGPIVEPAVPEFLGNLDHESRRANRLDLANWLTATEAGVGGLTARVQVNRYWYLLFGTGLSRSLDDFGGQGTPPSYPELLDELTLEFIESGWDVKHILKQILLSKAYRQSSIASAELLQKDPYNQLFARQGAYRLPAEVLRDNALMVSGLLNVKYGGESSHPYQPPGYYRHLNFPKREYEPDQDSQQYRRGVYVHWQRQFLHPMLKAFDAPSREECTAERPRSNTPLAALVLMNDPTFIEAARSFAARILEESNGTDQQRLESAFRRAVSRLPDEVESKVLLEVLAQNRKQFKEREESVAAFLDVGLNLETDQSEKQLDQQELAAWTTVTRVILNLNESITRN